MAYQYVTLVPQGGTPIYLADAHGAPYPTTGQGALVFNNGPTIYNANLVGYSITPPLNVTAGSVSEPSLYFGNAAMGFYAATSADISIAYNADNKFVFAGSSGTFSAKGPIQATDSLVIRNGWGVGDAFTTIQTSGDPATLTLPAGTQQLVGRTTTDTLINKSMDGNSNTFTNLPISALVGVVPIAKGGTGATTVAGAIENLETALVVELVSDIQLLTYRPESVVAKGYYAAGDGGGGVFSWVAGSTATTAAGMVIDPISGTAGRYVRQYQGSLNLKWFGAKGDNAFDNHDAFQAAFDFIKSLGSGDYAGATLYIPSGRYKTSSVSTDVQSVNMVGDVWVSPRILQYSNAQASLFTFTNTGLNAVFANLEFLGSTTTGTLSTYPTVGVLIEGGTTNWRNVRVNRCRTPIWIKRGNYHRLEDMNISFFDGAGIKLAGVDNGGGAAISETRITRAVINSGADDITGPGTYLGVQIQLATDCGATIIENSDGGSTVIGYELVDNLSLGNTRGPGFVTIRGCTPGNVSQASVWIKNNGGNFNAENCVFAAPGDTSGDGIRVDSPNASPRIYSSHFRNCQRSGIRITDGWKASILSSTFCDIGRSGTNGIGVSFAAGACDGYVVGNVFDVDLQVDESVQMDYAVRLATTYTGKVYVLGNKAYGMQVANWSNGSTSGSLYTYDNADWVMIPEGAPAADVQAAIDAYNCVVFPYPLELDTTVSVPPMKTLISLVSGEPVIASTADRILEVGGGGDEFDTHGPNFVGEWMIQGDTPNLGREGQYGIWVLPETYKLTLQDVFFKDLGTGMAGDEGNIRGVFFGRLWMYNLLNYGVRFYSKKLYKEIDTIVIPIHLENNKSGSAQTVWYDIGPRVGSGGKNSFDIGPGGIAYRGANSIHTWGVIENTAQSWSSSGGGTLTVELEYAHNMVPGDTFWLGGGSPQAILLNSQSWAANVVTFVTASDHGVPVGGTFKVAGSDPSGYNGTWTAIEGTQSRTLKATLLVDPGASNATGALVGYTTVNPIKLIAQSWTGGTAKYQLLLNTPATFAVGDTFQVVGSVPEGYNGNHVATRFVNDVIRITGQSWSGGTTTYTLAKAPSITAGEKFTVTGSVPTGYSGTFTAATVVGSTVTVTGTSNPGAYTTLGTFKACVVEAAVTDNPGTSAALGSWNAAYVCLSGTEGTTLVAKKVTDPGTCTTLGYTAIEPSTYPKGYVIYNAPRKLRVTGFSSRGTIHRGFALQAGADFEFTGCTIDDPGTSNFNYPLADQYFTSLGGDLTAQSWAANVVTFTTTDLHGLSPGDTFQTVNSTPDGYNGTWTAIAGTTGNTLTATLLVDPGASSVLGSVRGRNTFVVGSPLVAQSWASNVVTFTTLRDHGLSSGDTFVTTGSSPSGYNGTWTATAGTSGTVIKATLLSDPGASSTLGTMLRAHGVNVGDYFVVQQSDPEGYNGTYLTITVPDAYTVTGFRTDDPGVSTVLGNLDIPLDVNASGLYVGPRFHGSLRWTGGIFHETYGHGIEWQAIYAMPSTIMHTLIWNSSWGAPGVNSGMYFHPATTGVTVFGCTSGTADHWTHATRNITILSGNVSDGNTITFNGLTVTFRTTPSLPFEVTIGVDALTTAQNLVDFMLASRETEFAAVVPTVAASGTSATVTLVHYPGAIGNLYTLAKVGANILLGSLRLGGGTGARTQKYGIEGLQSGIRGNLIVNCNLNNNLSGPISPSRIPTVIYNTWTASGSFVGYDGAEGYDVWVWPGGGGGGSGRRGAAGTARSGGVGGGAGYLVRRSYVASELDFSTPITLTVGAGGSGGAAVSANDTNGNDGGAGGNSSFGSYLKAYGGPAGWGGTNAAVNAITGPSSLTGVQTGPYIYARTTSVTAAQDSTTPTGTTLPMGGGVGGSGGSLSTGNAELAPAQADFACFADPALSAPTGPAAGKAAGAAGSTSSKTAFAGYGGGGGGASDSAVTAAGAGGAGGRASGGGGGGAATNGANSGAGGAGGAGMIVVATRFPAVPQY